LAEIPESLTELPPAAACVCYVTAASRAEALRIGRQVVERRLAASANVVDGVSSLYWWQGALEQASEALLILKTRVELVPALTARVVELHGYQCPCVIALPVVGGHPDYLRWIAAETRPPEPLNPL
jgi:periplasmic divalent cation tolerance protein